MKSKTQPSPWICVNCPIKKAHAQSVLRKGSYHSRLLWKYLKGRFIQQLPLHGDPVEASGAHNGVTLIIEQQEPQQCEEQDTNSIGQIPLQLILASIYTDEH